MQRGLSPVRVGQTGKVKPSLQSHTLESKLEMHPDAKRLQGVKDEYDRVEKRRSDLRVEIRKLREEFKPSIAERLAAMKSDIPALESEMKSLNARAYAINLAMLRDVMAAADVVSGLSSKIRVREIDDPPATGLHDMHHVSVISSGYY